MGDKLAGWLRITTRENLPYPKLDYNDLVTRLDNSNVF
jgi:hypothetical protein